MINRALPLVTGAAGQLGSILVQGLVSSGASVLASDVSLNQLRGTAEKLKWPKDQVELAQCDTRLRDDIVNTINLGISAFGGVSSLVANAGVGVFEPFLERTEKSVDWVMDVNIKGTWLCIQEFIKHRIQFGEEGCIVNIASHYGLVSPDMRIYIDSGRNSSEIYGATKAGIIQMTRYFAVHAAKHGIRTNTVSPGGILNSDNPQGKDFQNNYAYRCPMGRMGENHEMIGAIIFLLSPAASYINGHNLVVDGGFTSW